MKMNAKVFELPVYNIKFAEENEIPKLKALLIGGAIDEFIISAPTDFIGLNHIFNGERLDRLLSEIKVAAIDGAMFQFAREHNLKHAVLFQRAKLDTVDE